MQAFIRELKRRNVFRVAVVYAVAGWLVLQVADVLVGLLSLPGWSLRLVLLLLALAFPLFLIFSWVYEITPEGIKREKDIPPAESVVAHTGRKLDRVIIIVVVLAGAFLVGERLLVTRDQDTNAVEIASTGPQTSPIETVATSVAVLPFVDMSAAGDQEYFTDGLAEMLLNALAQVPDLQVAGRTSSFAFKGRNEDIRSIGEQLNVANILEGRVQKSGDRVRITAQLVSARDGYHLWSSSFDFELTDIFAVQDEIAVAVATALKVALLGDSEPTSALGARDPEAYNLCLQGRYFSNKLTPAALATAVEYYRQALAIDPDLALAWAGLADALANQTGFGEGGDFAAGFSEARRAAQRGLDLDPRLPEAHAALGDVQLSSDWDWTGAEQSYRRALASRPGDPDIRRRLAGLLTIQGRFAEATRELDQVIAKDPLYWRAYVDRINSAVAGGELERAEAMALEFVRVQPDFPFGHGTLGGIYYLQGRYAEALDQFALESYSFFSLMVYPRPILPSVMKVKQIPHWEH